MIQDTAVDVENDVVNASISYSVMNLLESNLSDREVRIITKRFGITTGRKETLHEIAVAENISRERVRQIEREVLKKLRNNEDLKELKDAFGS